MFRRKKEDSDEAEPAAEAVPSPAAPPSSLIRPQAAAERPPAAAPIRPEPQARAAFSPTAQTAAQPAAPPVAPRATAAGSPAEDEGQQLIVGKGIVLNGEITACDRLVVEGRIEATLSRTRLVEIAPSGAFKGAAEIERATIAGLYEGKLNCRGKLTIRGTGRVQGEVRYGEIEIEPGGVICGNVGATTG